MCTCKYTFKIYTSLKWPLERYKILVTWTQTLAVVILFCLFVLSSGIIWSFSIHANQNNWMSLRRCFFRLIRYRTYRIYVYFFIYSVFSVFFFFFFLKYHLLEEWASRRRHPWFCFWEISILVSVIIFFSNLH